MDIEQLNLLIPEDLPIQHQLDQASKENLTSSLNLLLRSLEADFPEQALSQAKLALKTLERASISLWHAGFPNVKQHQETQDYDNYFNVSHIQSDRPEISLIRSILVAYQRFLLLSNSGDLLDAQNLAMQRQGFITYVRLVSRVYDLSLNQNYAED